MGRGREVKDCNLFLMVCPGKIHAAVPHFFPLIPLPVWLFCPSLKTFSQRRQPHSWLRGSAVPCGGSVGEPAGTTWNRLEPAGTGCLRHRAAPASPHRGHPAGPAASALPPTPTTALCIKPHTSNDLGPNSNMRHVTWHAQTPQKTCLCPGASKPLN